MVVVVFGGLWGCGRPTVLVGVRWVKGWFFYRRVRGDFEVALAMHMLCEGKGARDRQTRQASAARFAVSKSMSQYSLRRTFCVA